MQPGDRKVKVRGVQVHGRAATEAVAGQRTAINLGGVDLGDVSRGETLMAPATLSVTRRIDAEIDLLPSAKPLKHGARVRVHNGTAEVLGRVSIAGPSATEVAPGARIAGPIPARGAGGADARRSLHHPRLLSASHDWRRPRARRGADAARHSHRGGPGGAGAPEGHDRRLRGAGGDDRRCWTRGHRALIADCPRPAWRRENCGPSMDALSSRGVVSAGDRLVGARHLADGVGAADRVGDRVSQDPPHERGPVARRGAGKDLCEGRRRRSSRTFSTQLKAARR